MLLRSIIALKEHEMSASIGKWSEVLYLNSDPWRVDEGIAMDWI